MEQSTEEATTASTPPPVGMEQPTEEADTASTPPSGEAEAVTALMKQVHSIVQSNTFKAFQSIMTAHEKDLDEERKITMKAAEETEAVKAELERSRKQIAALEMELNSNHTDFEKLVNKNKELESETENLRNEIRGNEETISATAAELEKSRAQVEETEKARSAAEAELDQAQKNLDASYQEVARKSSQFQGLEDFIFPLMEVKREEITHRLQNLFVEAYGLVSTFFHDDFDAATLSNKATWNHFGKQQPAGSLPLPRTNTAAAKRMRAAAVLGVLAAALAERLFQPTYLLADSNEVGELLDELVDEGAAQERHLRASLLCFDAPQQARHARARESRVVHDVAGLAGRLLPPERQPDFRRRLARLVRAALEAWAWVQRLAPRVEHTMEPDEAETWLLLPDAGPAAAAGEPPSPPGEPRTAAPDDIRAVVWPGFLIQGPDDAELVGEGFVIDKSQAQAAADEEPVHRGHRKGSRSGARPGAAVTNGNGAMLHKRLSSSEPDEQSDDG